MTQRLIVAVIVALAALYALWRWMPGAWRRPLAARAAALARRGGLVDAPRAERLAAALAKTPGCGGGGGACDRCGACPGAAPRSR
jgi:hypothetical protein